MVRPIIRINENKCNGCGQCVPDCPEGALQIIDGKARLVSDLFCDGLGACIGRCPLGAIEVETREAVPYDEKTVMLENIIPKGKNTILAHLSHLDTHGANDYLEIALRTVGESSLIDKKALLEDFVKGKVKPESSNKSGCPGSREVVLDTVLNHSMNKVDSKNHRSELTQWPIQLHLINPLSGIFKGADLLVAADCTAFALGGFHGQLLKNKKLVIACPKLDQGQDTYRDKLIKLIDTAGINTLTLAIMEVPCCGGLVYLAKQALEKASRKVPIKQIIVSISGEILEENWL
jgi:NAD-dependent dihydropyrimidine dehydrogenase PreA subunit